MIIAFVALFCALIVGFLAYNIWRAGLQQERILLMHRVLEREGVSVEGCTEKATLIQTAAAARRCLLCRHQETCVAWLVGEHAACLAEFCPNAGLIARLKAEQRASSPGPRRAQAMTPIGVPIGTPSQGAEQVQR
jgi:hypothetical protein